MIVERTLAPGFEALREQFASHFERTDEFCELGAALAVYQHGRKVVDLHGGFLDLDRKHPWTEHSVTNIWSASKGVMALAIAQLVDRGLLDYREPVATWWPEFAQAGKGSITLEQVVSHRAGLNGFSAPTTTDDLFDWNLIVERLAQQAPLWSPGSTASYHGMTFGWLTGELIRRVTGMMPRDYIREAIAGPLGADLSLGIPEERQTDVATIVPPLPDKNPVALNAIAQYTVANPVPDATNANRPEWRQAQIPAVNIHCTADGLARMYGALANGGVIDGQRLLSVEGLSALTRPRGNAFDEMLGPRQWAAGVALNTNDLYGDSPNAFGHSGWGGSFAYADPDRGIGIAYIVNRMGSALNGDPRARAIIAALSASQ